MPDRSATALTPAAQYVRMSTEHQRYSADNQAQAIELYATAHGFEVVQTYADLGRSGLTIEKRPALQQLIADVQSGRADYRAVLVYDVSRWGRFQDPDEAAAYEQVCKRAGIGVYYCAEVFDNDGSAVASILKVIRRVMAAEYSRDLSEKIFAAQRQGAVLGYMTFNCAPLGTQRMLVDKHGRQVRLLAKGERNLRDHRVTLVPGPLDELRYVRRMFALYGRAGWTLTRIARWLNDEGVPARRGDAWTGRSVRGVLRSEIYIGNNVFGRTARKLGGRQRRVPPSEWSRGEGVFQPIVGRQLFRDVQRRLGKVRHMTDDQMITALADLYARHGYLSAPLIDAQPDMLRSTTYATRYGGLSEAYRRVGYQPEATRAFAAVVQTCFAARDRVRDEVTDALVSAGHRVAVHPLYARLVIDEGFTMDVRASRPKRNESGGLYWNFHDDRREKPPLTLFARLDDAFCRLDCWLITSADLGTRRNLHVGPRRLAREELEVFTSLDGLYDRCARLLGRSVLSGTVT